MNTICKIPLALLASAALFLSPLVSAQVISYGGTDMVTSNSTSLPWNINDPADNFTWIPFSDSTALTPPSNYNGPAIYGGASQEVTPGFNFTGTGRYRMVNNAGGDFLELFQNISWDTTPGKNRQMAAITYFKSDDPFAITANDAFSTAAWGTMQGTGAEILAGRWVVRDNVGDLYVSQETFALGTSKATFTSSSLLSTNWALFDTSNDDMYQSYGTFGSITLSGLTGAGVYLEYARPNIDNNGGNGSFQLAEFTAIPEPGTYALIAGILALGLVLLRRRRA